ncbi:unnamed protein product [Paramecium sonneborni]|uniref:Protein kinase domain-containing protein n=1 Tax=Paramecium sonneborni TaxID=65129 RepID=A0A8S1R904_9CILI|nr:unnamed protein product [Paramecium sonneborni]
MKLWLLKNTKKQIKMNTKQFIKRISVIQLKSKQQIRLNSFPIIVQKIDYQRLNYDLKNQYFLQMVYGVDQLHELGLFHRDLKPKNFVYFEKPNNQKIIKLKDFEFKNCFVETQYYIAPEVINSTFYDKSVDIWTLGTIWYEMLTNYFMVIVNPKYLIKYYVVVNQIQIKKFKTNKIFNKKKKIQLKRCLKIFLTKEQN